MIKPNNGSHTKKEYIEFFKKNNNNCELCEEDIRTISNWLEELIEIDEEKKEEIKNNFNEKLSDFLEENDAWLSIDSESPVAIVVGITQKNKELYLFESKPFNSILLSSGDCELL